MEMYYNLLLRVPLVFPSTSLGRTIAGEGFFVNGAMLQSPVLVLNATYEPVNVCAARRAIILILNGVALAEEEATGMVRSPSLAMRVPSVIRLLEYHRIPYQVRALSRKNILIRDRHTCQFCGRVLAASELTLDHVIPRSQGGEIHMGESRSFLPRLQQPQGRPRAGGRRHEANAPAAALQFAHQPSSAAADRHRGR